MLVADRVFPVPQVAHSVLAVPVQVKQLASHTMVVVQVLVSDSVDPVPQVAH